MQMIHMPVFASSAHVFCQTPVLGLGLEVDFTFTWDNNDNPHLNFLKGTVLGDMEQGVGVGIRDKG